MTDFKYDIASLPDYPALQQLARALWRDGSVRGASILVGAGMSKNAQRPADDSPEPPLWGDLLKKMVARLYSHDPDAAPKDPLRIAEQYRTYFGQAGLDEFIRTNFPEKSWLPGTLHADLLKLPWTDVLTTNWDTLLERAAENLDDYSYEVVRTEADLTFARSPRIVKLHGTISDAGPLIFAEEDYRTYPTKYAAFVNFARQVFIENELCLFGFSGDDPNFGQWAGWVRDHLGGSARRIYLVGNLHLERAARKYLEAHNVAPIDFAPLVKDLPWKLQHTAATRIFIEELRKAKPSLRHEWKPTKSEQFPLHLAGIDAYQRVHKDHAFAADLLKKTVPLFKADRASYPGWLICPNQFRHSLIYDGDAHRLLRKSVLDLLEPRDRAEALFEILWRRTTAFAPIDVRFAEALTEVLDTKPPEVEAEMRLEFALALMRDARVSRDDEGMKRWSNVIETEPPAESALRLEVEYQWCLRARDRMDLGALATRLVNITSDEPIWKLRRAALHTEVAEYAAAAKLIKEATAELERRHRLDRNSLRIKAQLAWASWISRAADMLSVSWADLPQPRDYRELDIDPLGEIKFFSRRANKLNEELRAAAVAVRPAFEAGHYRESSDAVYIGSDNSGAILLYELDQLIEQVGLPCRINHVNICADAMAAVVEAAQQDNLEWRVWLLRAVHSHMDKQFERHFGRIALAQMSAATSPALVATVENAIAFWTQKMAAARSPELRSDFSRTVDALRLMLVTLSRLTVRMSPAHAIDTLHRATKMAVDPQFSNMWLIEALGEIIKFAVGAVPVAEQAALVLTILEFPLPSEKGGNVPFWPRLIAEIWNVRPDRPTGDPRWDHRIHQLLMAAQKGAAEREYPILCLAYLALQKVLRPDEAAAFGKALWSDVDAQENALPQNATLGPGILLQLPADDGIDVKARLGARLFDADLREVMSLRRPMGSIEIGRKIDDLNATTQAVRLGLDLSADVAAKMFDQIVVWELQTSDRQDPMGTSFFKSFNDSARLAAGYLLTVAVVPALVAEQRTEQRARDLMAFIMRTRSWTGVGALPLFFSSAGGARDSIVAFIRRGLIGLESQHVGAAALAVSGWAELVRKGTISELPRRLIEQLVAAVETCREIGLAALLDAVRKLLETEFLKDEDFRRLLETLAVIRSEFQYRNVELDTMGAVSISLARAACVKLAAALKGRLEDDGTLQGWIDDSKSDPLPEVRFALESNE
jgi:hypothetical protein